MTQQIAAEFSLDSRWWRDAVVYQIYLRSFADGDGDGVGDLLGVRSRLRYLSWLGVDALRLTPFSPAPAVSGHRATDPGFGTLGDTESLIHDAHRYGLKILVDVAPGHTSTAHPWFGQAASAAPGSPERDRYVFGPGRGDLPPNDWTAAVGGPAWSRLPDGEWYLHLLAPGRPDLNWRNPDVRADFEDLMRFWLERGVDGFGIDTGHGMVQAEPSYLDQDGVHDIHRSWRRLLDSYGGIGVAEAWAPAAGRRSPGARPRGLHQAFNLPYLTAEWSAARLRKVIDDSLAAAGPAGAPATWALSSHDVQRHVTRFGDGWIGARRARAAALLTLALPGSTHLYQGEELGLPEVTDLPPEYLRDPRRGDGPGRDGCRIPIPWAYTEPPFGFSPPMVGESWLPVPSEWRNLTVETQTGDPRSMLRLYHDALRLRKELPALGDGALRWLDGPEDLLVFERDPGFVCAVNFGRSPVPADAYGTLLLSSGRMNDGVLDPDSAAWWARA